MHALICESRIRRRFPCTGGSGPYKAWLIPMTIPTFPAQLSVFRIDKNRCLSTFSPCPVSVSRWPSGAFLFVELLLTFQTKSLAMRNQALLLLDVSLSPVHVFPSEGFSFNIVNCVRPVQGSDRLQSPSTFQKSSIRLSSSAHRVELLVQRDDDRCNSLRLTKKTFRTSVIRHVV